jgi:hypothetical protein
MKIIVSTLLSFIVLNLCAQKKGKGFIHLGPTLYQHHSGGKPYYGGEMGLAFSNKLADAGASFEAFTQKNEGIYTILHGDLNVRFKREGTSPFVLFQPGYIFRDRTYGTVPYQFIERGGLFAAGGLGLISKTKHYGFLFQLKYCMLSSRIYQKKNTSSTLLSDSRPGYLSTSLSLVF